MSENSLIAQNEFEQKHVYFSISEFCIAGRMLPRRIADLILTDHIVPMNRVRAALGAPISVSKKSGYRPRAYEISKGRAGTSQHNFEKEWPNGTGAADYTCRVASDLIPFLLKHTSYTRICHYPNNNFVHCDYKPNTLGGRCIFTAQSPTSPWVLKEAIKD